MSTALTSLDQLGQQAAAHLSRIDIYIKRHDDNYIAAGKYLIEARQICRVQKIAWIAWLATHQIDRTKAHIAIAEAGGDASMEEGGGRRAQPIKAADPARRREQVRKAQADFRARRNEKLLLITSSTVPAIPPPSTGVASTGSDATPREVKVASDRCAMLARIATLPDDILKIIVKDYCADDADNSIAAWPRRTPV